MILVGAFSAIFSRAAGSICLTLTRVPIKSNKTTTLHSLDFESAPTNHKDVCFVVPCFFEFALTLALVGEFPGNVIGVVVVLAIKINSLIL